MNQARLEELERLEAEAFRAPWTYSEWEIECPCGGDQDCTNKECDGAHVPCTTIESPDEYPGGQVVAQFQVPGLSCLADKNGEFICALRNSAKELIQAAKALDGANLELEVYRRFFRGDRRGCEHALRELPTERLRDVAALLADADKAFDAWGRT